MKLGQFKFWVASIGLLMAVGAVLLYGLLKEEVIVSLPLMLGNTIAMYLIAFGSALWLLPRLNHNIHLTIRGLLFVFPTIILAAISVFLLGNSGSSIGLVMGYITASLAMRTSEESPE